jgi:hypothetical protein
MADETRRLRPAELQADTGGYAALQEIEDYNPSKAEYTLVKVTAANKAATDAQTKETQAEAALKKARDAAAAAEWAFHNVMLGVKTQVIAQYGESSDEVQSIGLKKKSEYKRPSRRAAKPNGGAK